MSKFTHTTNQEFFDSLDKRRPHLVEVASTPVGLKSRQKIWFVYLSSAWRDITLNWVEADWKDANIPCRLIKYTIQEDDEQETEEPKTIVFKSADDFYNSELWKTEDQIIKAWVEHNPFGKGGKAKIPFRKTHEGLESFPEHRSYFIYDVDYAYTRTWHEDYTGTFTVDLPLDKHS